MKTPYFTMTPDYTPVVKLMAMQTRFAVETSQKMFELAMLPWKGMPTPYGLMRAGLCVSNPAAARVLPEAPTTVDAMLDRSRSASRRVAEKTEATLEAVTPAAGAQSEQAPEKAATPAAKAMTAPIAAERASTPAKAAPAKSAEKAAPAAPAKPAKTESKAATGETPEKASAPKPAPRAEAAAPGKSASTSPAPARAKPVTAAAPSSKPAESAVAAKAPAAAKPASAVDQAVAATVAAMVEPAKLPAPQGKADDLTQLGGVGPKLAEALNAQGIWHYRQIAEWSEANVAWVDENLPGVRGRAARNGWVAQAAKLDA